MLLNHLLSCRHKLFKWKGLNFYLPYRVADPLYIWPRVIFYLKIYLTISKKKNSFTSMANIIDLKWKGLNFLLPYRVPDPFVHLSKGSIIFLNIYLVIPKRKTALYSYGKYNPLEMEMMIGFSQDFLRIWELLLL